MLEIRIHATTERDLARYLAHALRHVDEQTLVRVARALIDEGFSSDVPGYEARALLERAFGVLGEFIAEQEVL
jgi:hypothetical protein